VTVGAYLWRLIAISALSGLVVIFGGIEAIAGSAVRSICVFSDTSCEFGGSFNVAEDRIILYKTQKVESPISVVETVIHVFFCQCPKVLEQAGASEWAGIVMPPVNWALPSSCGKGSDCFLV
jgi:hypothetical protein